MDMCGTFASKCGTQAENQVSLQMQYFASHRKSELISLVTKFVHSLFQAPKLKFGAFKVMESIYIMKAMFKKLWKQYIKWRKTYTGSDW